jgi:Spy/CpxP family protein refolding chaperone
MAGGPMKGFCPKKGLDDKLAGKMHMAVVNAGELGLTDEQVDQIIDLKVKMKKDVIQYNAKIDTVKIDIKYELWKDQIDRAKIDEQINVKYDMKKDKAKSLVAYLVEFKGILSDEQNEQLKSMCLKGRK